MKKKKITPYKVISLIILCVVAFTFVFPFYWIITGAFKSQSVAIALPPQWFPTEPTMANFEKLFKNPAWQWMLNTVLMALGSMLLVCGTAALCGYALAKKRFPGRALLFSLIVCAMALPKQVILIPLIKEISAIGLWDNIWAVIFPTVGWPFGVFLMKQFSEGIPGEILEAARIDGAGEVNTFITVVCPIIKPGFGALAIFTFINTWNDYFLQLIMLGSGNNFTISLGIATFQAETSIDVGILMAGATLAAIPIIAIFLAFQKYFTQGITMGAVKG